MIRRLLVFIWFLFCSIPVHAIGGNGGPISVICMRNLSSINEHIGQEEYGIPPFANQYNMVGGVGTSWPMKNFGVGFSLIAGSQMVLKEDFNSYASLQSIIAFINLENVLFESKTVQLSLKFGPGYTTEHLALVSGGERTDYTIDSMIFHFGVGTQLKLSEIARLELSVNQFLVPADKWIRLSGTASEPPNTRFDSYFMYVGVRFGSSFFEPSQSN